ncbi:MAG: glucokinase [Xanthomonadaceae bacterium]|jgi:glucokinase|nr:glucokinase [Xanthomonadaceae bacterium]
MMSARLPILVADIGGTNARFALARHHAESPLASETVREFPVADFPSLAHAAQHYLEQAKTRAESGLFAVAGRVDGGQARITNHPWVISRDRTREALGFRHLELINDFAAQAMSIPCLQSQDVEVIGPVQWQPRPLPQSGRYAVIGPGTGLGIGGLIVRDGQRLPLQTEGGHAGFPPGTPEEIRILEILSRQFGRVSNERLVCGPGLVNIHRALSEISGQDPGLPGPADITAGANRGDPVCARALEVFCAVFGALAGDLVLTFGAWDGVFLTGGLVPRLLERLRNSGFRERFEHKGRFAPAMAAVPSMAVLHPHPGLLGAAAYAVDRYSPR